MIEGFKEIFSDNYLFRNMMAFMLGYVFILYQLNWFHALILMLTLWVFYCFLGRLLSKNETNKSFRY